jgi:hypothetical protein
MVVLAPGGAVLMSLIVEKPEYWMLSKFDRNRYLSRVRYLPFSVSCFHCRSISALPKRPALREVTAFSKSARVIVRFLGSAPAPLKDRKNWKEESQSAKEHWTAFLSSIIIWSSCLKA